MRSRQRCSSAVSEVRGCHNRTLIASSSYGLGGASSPSLPAKLSGFGCAAYLPVAPHTGALPAFAVAESPYQRPSLRKPSSEWST